MHECGRPDLRSAFGQRRTRARPTRGQRSAPGHGLRDRAGLLLAERDLVGLAELWWLHELAWICGPRCRASPRSRRRSTGWREPSEPLDEGRGDPRRSRTRHYPRAGGMGVLRTLAAQPDRLRTGAQLPPQRWRWHSRTGTWPATSIREAGIVALLDSSRPATDSSPTSTSCRSAQRSMQPHPVARKGYCSAGS